MKKKNISKKKNQESWECGNCDSGYSFYWNYNDQLAHDRLQKRKKRKRRTLIAGVTALVALLLVTASIGATVLWGLKNFDFSSVPQVPESSQNQPQQSQQSQQSQPSKTTLTTAEIAEKLNPTVVFIHAVQEASVSMGAGFLISADGYIVTNHHIIEDALRVQVTLYEGTYLDATVVGYRAEDDIAVLKVEGNNYPTAQIGDSSIVKAGDVAVLIGHPSGEEGRWSTTQGVISSTNRVLSIEEESYFCEIKMFQTDATGNKGNSGGPLCNDRGEVIGIMTRKQLSYEGMNYAIPVNEAMLTVNAIINDELDGFVSSVSQSRPKIGVTGVEILTGDIFAIDGVEYTAPVPGFWVSEVSKNSKAYGIIQVGDIICGLNGVTVTNFDTFKAELYKCHVGQEVTVEIYRKNQKMTVQFIIGMVQ